MADPPTAPDYGFIRVIVLSTGGDLDLDGFTLVIDAERPVQVTVGAGNGANITSSYYTAGGDHAVMIQGIASNCALEGAPVRSVSVVRGQITEVTFEVRCVATGIAVTTRTTGPDSPDNFELVLDQTHLIVAANGSQTIGRLTGGPHSLTLLTPERCTITGGLGQQTVTVTVKTVVPVPFEVTCTAVERLEKIAFVHDSIVSDSTITLIGLVKPDGTGALRLGEGVDPAWSPARDRLVFSQSICDDYYFYYYGCSYGLVLIDPETRTVAANFGVSGNYPVLNPSWAPAGDAIAFDAESSPDAKELKVLRLSSGAVETPGITGPRSKEQPSWSPDGTRIAFVCRWAANTDLCTVTANGGIPVRMTDDAEVDLHPAWSPDGSTIAFARTAAGSASPEIVLLDVATKVRTVLTTGTEPAWSPDGSKLVFAGGDGLFVIDANGSNRRRLTTGPDHAPAWRP